MSSHTFAFQQDMNDWTTLRAQNVTLTYKNKPDYIYIQNMVKPIHPLTGLDIHTLYA